MMYSAAASFSSLACSQLHAYASDRCTARSSECRHWLQGWFIAGCAFLVVVMVGLLKNGAQRAYSKGDDVRSSCHRFSRLQFCALPPASNVAALGILTPALLLPLSLLMAAWGARTELWACVDLQLGKVYTTLTSSLLVLWWIYPIGERRVQLVQPSLT